LIALLYVGDLSAQAGDDGLPGLFGAGRYAEAEAVCRTQLETAPADAEALYYMGRLTDDLGASDRYLGRLMVEHPGHPLADDALFGLAESAYAGPLGLYLKARRFYAKLVQAYPESPHVPMALYRIGLTHLVVQETEVAAATFQRVVDLHPGTPAAFRSSLRLAEVAAARGDLKRAAALVDSLGATAPDSLKQMVKAAKKQ
jgi:TolA-binding protein